MQLVKMLFSKVYCCIA